MKADICKSATSNNSLSDFPTFFPNTASEKWLADQALYPISFHFSILLALFTDGYHVVPFAFKNKV